jgi:hypothetical protein
MIIYVFLYIFIQHIAYGPFFAVFDVIKYIKNPTRREFLHIIWVAGHQ